MGKLRRLRRRLEAFERQKRSIKSAKLITFAKSVGRTEVDRGKHVTLEMEGRDALTIPSHSGTLKTGTASGILGVLEEDIILLEEQEARKANHKGGGR